MVVNVCEKRKDGVNMTNMTGDKAVELINEWLNLAKEVSDMNLNRMEYDEERYNYAMDRMDVIRQEINEYHEQMNKKRED